MRWRLDGLVRPVPPSGNCNSPAARNDPHSRNVGVANLGDDGERRRTEHRPLWSVCKCDLLLRRRTWQEHEYW